MDFLKNTAVETTAVAQEKGVKIVTEKSKEMVIP